MTDSEYTTQDLRIFQYRLDGATDEWIMDRLSVDAKALVVSKNRMTRCVAAWFDVDYQSIDAFVESNCFAVLSRVISALDDLSRVLGNS